MSGGGEARAFWSREWGCAVVQWWASVQQCVSQHSSTYLASAIQLLWRFDYKNITLSILHIISSSFYTRSETACCRAYVSTVMLYIFI